MEEFYTQDLANFLTKLFASEQIVKQIAMSTHGDFGKISHSIGLVITFVVATRSKNIDSKMIRQILNNSNQSYSIGDLVAREIGNSLIAQNKIPSAENILKVLKQNIVDRGVLMHATCQANVEGILENGFDYKIKPFKEEKEFLANIYDYEFDFRSNRLYVTNHYGVLYNYGLNSPEWLTNFVGDKNACIKRSHQKAYQLMKKKFDDKWTDAVWEKADKYIKNLAKTYFDGPQNVALVLFDRLLCDEYGKRVFNKYNEEEDSFDEGAFTIQFLQKHFEKQVDKDKSIFVVPNSNEFTANAVNYLINKTSIFEYSTLSPVFQKDFSIAYLPPYSKFAMYEKQNIKE